ncbi:MULTISPECIES: D-alanyl-D-alanine carboxypeptidase family protein [Gordonia]|uniref:D-alanyl-D-alanine carboxypeptidase n=1 Tax=Gordonia sputi NBRC 100414 TaxID=1089453 RepID=H5U4Y0_9ACTN|nr:MULTISPECIES: serine hydrolase [Gordonia]MCM3896918.1 serine hydrolase [Gordonia sputi]OBA37673.1 peptidase S11 [Gordonia sp. 852002-51296_SCH5728562-b]OBA73028.1 peptidase S11 [Gordonia sp. 852002-10350_SCH5691597]OBC07235.1 peptidase S11 [Gordonia sp. 852002-50395_SCH5434458]GAB40788.1 D-alanyl-D-alanine carboxypeptidase [Gordonia sputi NBRC 100414]
MRPTRATAPFATDFVVRRVVALIVAVVRIAAAVGIVAVGAIGPGLVASPAWAAPTQAQSQDTSPDTDHCPHRVSPPPAVDESEVVAPGSTTPTPLPVHSPPVGGEALGGCGVVADSSAGRVPERLTSAAWLVADLDSGAVIAAKDPHGRYRPASTIKILLALTALRSGISLDKPVTATADDWSAEGDSCGMGPGGKYTMRDMMIGLLMVSGNDCAHVIARDLGGIDATLTKMNQLAHSLQAYDTRASTPSGLDSAGMSTSPYDLAVIFRAAMQNSTFRDIIAMPNHPFPGYPKRPDVPGDVDHPGYLMQTSNHLLLEGDPGVLGGKTGYTDDAQKTFVGAVKKDGRTVLVVQMYGLSTADDNYWDQARSLVAYGAHAPREAKVGELASTSGERANTSDDARVAVPTTEAEASTPQGAALQESTSGWSVRILVGLVGLLAALLLLLLALRLIRRR